MVMNGQSLGTLTIEGFNLFPKGDNRLIRSHSRCERFLRRFLAWDERSCIRVPPVILNFVAVLFCVVNQGLYRIARGVIFELCGASGRESLLGRVYLGHGVLVDQSFDLWLRVVVAGLKAFLLVDPLINLFIRWVSVLVLEIALHVDEVRLGFNLCEGWLRFDYCVRVHLWLVSFRANQHLIVNSTLFHDRRDS